MRTLFVILSLATAAAGLAACTSDSNSAALRAMEPVNSCGPGGTQDIDQCSNR